MATCYETPCKHHAESDKYTVRGSCSILLDRRWGDVWRGLADESLETRPCDISFARWVSRADRCLGRGTHKHVLYNAVGQATPRCVATTQMPKAGENVWRKLLNNRFYPNRRTARSPLSSRWREMPRTIGINIYKCHFERAVVIVSVVFLIGDDACHPFFRRLD